MIKKLLQRVTDICPHCCGALNVIRNGTAYECSSCDYVFPPVDHREQERSITKLDYDRKEKLAHLARRSDMQKILARVIGELVEATDGLEEHASIVRELRWAADELERGAAEMERWAGTELQKFFIGRRAGTQAHGEKKQR